jgi:hypothetical protein
MNALEEKILDTFPSGSYALTALLRLMDIVESDSVPTAAVECRVQPRLLVNPEFVDRHANTPERLLMLVMHELHHVLLGHTTLFKTVTKTDNFVFDSVFFDRRRGGTVTPSINFLLQSTICQRNSLRQRPKSTEASTRRRG